MFKYNPILCFNCGGCKIYMHQQGWKKVPTVIAVVLTIVSARQNILLTQGKSLKDNIGTLFGAKQFKSLQVLDYENSTAKYLFRRFRLTFLRVYGYISQIESGCGRSAADRQFLYLNNSMLR
jgi:hypothetical protein